MLSHDIERGHQCPQCGSESACLLEDGFCENHGTCDSCIKAAVYAMPNYDMPDNLSEDEFDSLIYRHEVAD